MIHGLDSISLGKAERHWEEFYRMKGLYRKEAGVTSKEIWKFIGGQSVQMTGRSLIG